MEYSRTLSAVPGNFRKKRKKFLTNPIQIVIEIDNPIVYSLIIVQYAYVPVNHP